VNLTNRVMIVGLGDLAERLATKLVSCQEIGELVLAGRQVARGESLARLLGSVGGAPTRFVAVDALQEARLTEVFAQERPALIVQCGSLMSPWALHERNDHSAVALKSAGFAVQLPAQLPIILSVMRSVRAAKLVGPVVNCSYPDVTHPILSCLGMAPTAGVGNVGMVRSVVQSALKQTLATPPLVRVLAHHAHVSSVMSARPTLGGATLARVYLGEAGERADHLAYGGPPLALERQLNSVSAAHAFSVIRALLSTEQGLRTSLPGPNGLPGGFPVVIRDQKVALDLPPSLSLASALAFQTESALQDGLDHLRPDGTAVFTAASRHATRDLPAELTAPLHPDAALERFGLLERVLNGGS
jgi:hypothetical protein